MIAWMGMIKLDMKGRNYPFHDEIWNNYLLHHISNTVSFDFDNQAILGYGEFFMLK